jgi:hypothetical protein
MNNIVKKTSLIIIKLIILSPVLLLVILQFYHFGKYGDWQSASGSIFSFFIFAMLWNLIFGIYSYLQIIFIGCVCMSIFESMCIIFKLDFFIKIFCKTNDIKTATFLVIIFTIILIIITTLKWITKKILKSKKPE